MALNPFSVALAAALLVLGVIVVSSRRRNELQTPAARRGPLAMTGPGVLPTPALVLALAVLLVPFGIAIAALWGAPVGVGAYLVSLVGSLIAVAVARRSRH